MNAMTADQEIQIKIKISKIWMTCCTIVAITVVGLSQLSRLLVLKWLMKLVPQTLNVTAKAHGLGEEDRCASKPPSRPLPPKGSIERGLFVLRSSSSESTSMASSVLEAAAMLCCRHSCTC